MCVVDELMKSFVAGSEVSNPSRLRYKAIVKSVSDYVRIVEVAHVGHFHYRGQRRKWPLKPTLARLHVNDTDLITTEENTLRDIRFEAPELGGRPDIRAYSNLDLAILGQHHGAPTRLLDWTISALTALYFAVEQGSEEDEKHDGVVVATTGGQEEPVKLLTPDGRNFAFNNELPVFIRPHHLFARAAVQMSTFALWREPRKEFLGLLDGKRDIWEICIPSCCKANFRWALYCLGISRVTLFPDLDGHGRYLQWKQDRRHQEVYQDTFVPCYPPQRR